MRQEYLIENDFLIYPTKHELWVLTEQFQRGVSFEHQNVFFKLIGKVLSDSIIGYQYR